MKSLLEDLRYGLRLLAKSPSFTLVAALSLALGIGATTATFSFIDAILLRPLSVPTSGRLVTLDTGTSSTSRFGASSYPDYVDFRDRAKSFSGLVAYSTMAAGMNAGDAASQPQVVWGLIASGNLFSALGIEPALGRAFRPDEDQKPGQSAVAVISYALWQRRFASDTGVVGTTIRLNGHPFTIIGVAPRSFTGLDLYFVPDLFVPSMMQAQVMPAAGDVLHRRSNRWLAILGVLRSGVAAKEAQAEMNVIARDLDREHPDTNKGTVVTVLPELERRLALSKEDAQISAVVMGLVGLVLLIACANVANLLRARAAARSREIAVRLAVGAGRSRLIRQLLTESLLLALLGGTLGLLLGYWGIQLLAAVKLPAVVPVRLQVELSARVLAVSATAALLTALLFGLAPAVQASNVNLTEALKDARADLVPGSSRLGRRGLLIVGQVALSVILLVSAGLLLKAYRQAQSVSPGFSAENVLLVDLDPGFRGYSQQQGRAFYKQLLERLRSLPGVESVSLGRNVPFLSGNSWDISIDGYQAPCGREMLDISCSASPPCGTRSARRRSSVSG